MVLAMNVLTALLVFIAGASAVPAHFPHEKTLVYRYYADVKAGTIEPVPYASQFALDGVLYIKHHTSDAALTHAYYAKLSNVMFGLYNGQAVHYQKVNTTLHIPEAAKVLEDPFLIVYDENGKFQGVKLEHAESEWSKNVKQAIASMLQLDLSLMQVNKTVIPHSFITMENTIHGECQVAYNVQPKDQHHPETSKEFVVTKLYEPKDCTKFVQRVHDHVECLHCHVEPEDAMSTASRRVFEIENQGKEILIKKLIGHGVVNYFPLQARSEAHYLLNNQSLVLDSVVPVTQITLPAVDFKAVDILRDVSFKGPETEYAVSSGKDLTQGRHQITPELLILKLKNMLIEAADYLEANHVDLKEPDRKHGQTINRIHHIMIYMDNGSLEEVYNAVHVAKTQREETMKNIFLEMVPTVGTRAACLFTRDVISKQKVSNSTALMMLHKLPMHVKYPSVQLLLEMEVLIKLGPSIPKDIRVASIMCFSRMIHKLYKDEATVTDVHLNRYIQHFFTSVKHEPSYHMKMVNMMALKNIKLPQVCKILEPVIRGDVMISEKPYHIRVQAIWAIQDVVMEDLEYIHNLLWPVLSDTSLPLTVRIAAYNVLIKQIPNMRRMMNLYWFMVYEKNEHLYNYHLTTIKGLANSVDPCLRPVREMVRKILRFTRIRPVDEPLSANYFVDYVNPKYEYGESVRTALVLDELTGHPNTGSVEHIHMLGRKLVPTMGIYWNVNGLDEVMHVVKTHLLGNVVNVISDKKVLDLLMKAAKDMPAKKEIHMDICVTLNGQVSHVMHYDQENLMKIFDVLKDWKNILFGVTNTNVQRVMYNTLYEMHVPTDMGLPAVLGTKIPTLMSFTFSSNFTKTKMPLNLDLKMDITLWQHGEYAMSIYNPIADVWHSISRIMSHDSVFPVDMTVGYNYETSSLKITLPRLPINKYSVAGLLNYAKNYVTIMDDETDVLKQCCSNCNHYEVVTKGSAYKEQHINSYDSTDAGLRYTVGIFNCENGVTPSTRIAEFIKAMSPEHKNTWNNTVIQAVMGLRQQLMNDFMSPEIGSCGTLFKMEPSIIYPTSSVDISVRTSVEDKDDVNNMHVLSSKKVNVHATVDVKAAGTNTTTRSLEMNANLDTSQGHFNNNLKVQMTRVTPGEKKLRVCIDGQKNYQVFDVDPLKLGTMKEDINTKVTLTMGLTDTDSCVRDDTVVTMTVKSEITDEQKKQMIHDSVYGACAQDIQNQYFATQQGHIPKTTNCIRETILHTTPRKYSMNITHKNVPQSVVSTVTMLENLIRSVFLPHLRYTTSPVESGNVKMVVEYPVGTDHMDVTVNTPVHGYKMVELPIVLMDNTRFPMSFLKQLHLTETRMCTVYPQIVLTADGGRLPFKLSDQYTLLLGDHVNKTFAIFGKTVQTNKIAVKMYASDQKFEIVPTDTKPRITNDTVLYENGKGFTIPDNEFENYTFKIIHSNQHTTVQTTHAPVMVMHTPNSVTLMLSTTLRGSVTGICGHMDNTHKEKIPKVYTIAV